MRLSGFDFKALNQAPSTTDLADVWRPKSKAASTHVSDAIADEKAALFPRNASPLLPSLHYCPDRCLQVAASTLLFMCG